MADPKRLRHSMDGLGAELLHSGKQDRASWHSRQAILAGLGLTPALTLGEMASATAKATVKGGVAKSAAIVSSGGLLGGLAIWTAVTYGTAPPAPPVIEPAPVVVDVVPFTPPAPIVVEEVPAVASTESADEAPPQAAADSNDDSTAPAVARRPRSVTKEQLGLDQELSLLDSAKRALTSGDASSALSRLADYRRAFPRGSLRTEATVLQVEALVARGDHRGAARVGAALLKHSPNGPYARRIRSLIGESPKPEAGR